MVVGTASTMVTARPEQSQILIQHPDAPSPAQPQVSCVGPWMGEPAVSPLLFMSYVFQGAEKLQNGFQLSGHLPELWFLLTV